MLFLWRRRDSLGSPELKVAIMAEVEVAYVLVYSSSLERMK